MTRADLLAALGPWRAPARRWGPIVGCVVLGALFLRSCQDGRSARADAAALRARSAAEAKARAAGIAVVDQGARGDVAARVEEMERANEQLRAERDHARGELGRLRPLLAAHVETDAAPVSCAVAPPEPGRPVALYQNEPLRLAADLAVDETREGARVLTGTLEAVGPRGLLARRPVSQPLSRAASVEQPPPARRADLRIPLEAWWSARDLHARPDVATGVDWRVARLGPLSLEATGRLVLDSADALDLRGGARLALDL